MEFDGSRPELEDTAAFGSNENYCFRHARMRIFVYEKRKPEAESSVYWRNGLRWGATILIASSHSAAALPTSYIYVTVKQVPI